MSYLDKIQKIAKIGKILCSIVFIFCLIGIITIGVSIVTEVVAAIVYEIMSFIFVSTDSLEIGNWGSVGIGITFIVVSLICRYGVESGREQ